MICPDCHVEIACRTTVCPLCGTRLDTDDSAIKAINALPRAFPKRKRMPFIRTSLFDRTYGLVAISILLIALITELILTKGRARYFFVTAAAVFYLYFFIRGTVQNTSYFSQKVVAQALVLTAIGMIISPLLPAPILIYEYVLPSIYLVSIVMVGIYTLLHFNRVRLHLLNLINVAALAFFSLIVVLIPGVTLNSILAIVTASIGGAVILLVIVLGRKKLWDEIRRLFHI